jgi:hypothetical protein
MRDLVIDEPSVTAIRGETLWTACNDGDSVVEVLAKGAGRLPVARGT